MGTSPLPPGGHSPSKDTSAQARAAPNAEHRARLDDIGKAIGDGGMRALPFAVRCTVCETAPELAAPPRALPGGASRGRTARVA